MKTSQIKKESDKCFMISVNHELYLQEVHKSTLSAFDEKQCYITNI